MIPSFGVQVFPEIPYRLGRAYCALAAAHARLGSVTEIAGLYIVLAADTSVLAKKFRNDQMQILDANCTCALVVGIGDLPALVRPAFVSRIASIPSIIVMARSRMTTSGIVLFVYLLN